MPLPDDEDQEERQPPVEAIGDGGGSGKPRRPTAVGAGSPDDDFEERIADLRRYDLDALEDSPVPANEIQSWPIPGLTFVRIDGILGSWDLEQEEQRRIQQSIQIDPSALPKRMYLMEDALTGLNSQKANIAYLVLGSKTGVNYYMGISLQHAPEELKENDLAEVCYEILKSILHSVYKGVDIDKRIFDADGLKALVAPLAVNVGIASGVASLKMTGADTLESEQLERIASGLQGLDFGMLVLAAPVPSKMVSDEEFIVLDEIQKAQSNVDAEKKRRVKYYLELQDAYLKHIQLGQAIGHWQVGVYFFAPKPDVFVRLRSLIKATYTDEGSRPTPLRTHVFPGLKDHLLSFGLLRNRNENTAHKLFSYKFLSPLNSRMLSAYIHLPKREMS